MPGRIIADTPATPEQKSSAYDRSPPPAAGWADAVQIMTAMPTAAPTQTRESAVPMSLRTTGTPPSVSPIKRLNITQR